MMSMGSSTQHQFEWLESTFFNHSGPFAQHHYEEPSGSSGGLREALSIAPSLLDLTSTEQGYDLCHDNDTPSSGQPLDINGSPSGSTKHLKDAEVWGERRSRRSARSRRTSPSYVENETMRGSLEVPISSPLQPEVSSEPPKCKRRRGRPRLRPCVIDAENPDEFLVSRESQLEKNRIAAEKCRQRKKKYIARITADASTLASKNKSLKEDATALRQQLLDLKNELLRHASCGSWTIDKYIAQSASGQFHTAGPSVRTPSLGDSIQTSGSPISSSRTDGSTVQSVMEPLPSHKGSIDVDEYVNLWLSEDHDGLNVQ